MSKRDLELLIFNFKTTTTPMRVHFTDKYCLLYMKNIFNLGSTKRNFKRMPTALRTFEVDLKGVTYISINKVYLQDIFTYYYIT